MGPAVMVVDDEPLVRDFLVEAIRRDDRVVMTASDGEQAFAAFERFRPRIILTDFRMPRMDGLALIRSVSPVRGDTALVLLTGYWSDSLVTEATRAGAHRVLPKPLPLADIDALLDELLRDEAETALSPPTAVADAELWSEYGRSRDPRLREQLVERHLSMVRRVAARLASRLPPHVGAEDLASAGLFGLLGALEDYDPGRGVDFPTYASRRVRGAMFDELRKLDWVPRSIRRKARAADHAAQTLTKRFGRLPSDDELGRELGWDVARLRATFGDAPSALSLDAPQPGFDDVLTALDLLEDAATPDPLAAFATRQRHAMLSRLIAGLPEREQQVLALYYVEEMTMLETGRALGIGESRVSQLHTRAVTRLRKAFRGQGDLP